MEAHNSAQRWFSLTAVRGSEHAIQMTMPAASITKVESTGAAELISTCHALVLQFGSGGSQLRFPGKWRYETDSASAESFVTACNSTTCVHYQRRARQAKLSLDICWHTFRATSITADVQNGGALEHAQRIAAHGSPNTAKLYEIEGIVL